MREFFKGWRRKLGLALLVMSSVLAVAWLRSFFVEDRLAFTTGSHRNALCSYGGSIAWERWLDIPPAGGPGWSSSWRDLSKAISPRPTHYRARPGTALGSVQYESQSVAYWPIVVPIGLFSAWLILWKPRKPPA